MKILLVLLFSQCCPFSSRDQSSIYQIDRFICLLRDENQELILRLLIPTHYHKIQSSLSHSHCITLDNFSMCSHLFNSRMLVLPGGSVVKNLLANAGDVGSIPGWEDPLEKEMETHFSMLAWEIPWTEEPGRLYSMGLQRVRHSSVT